MSQIGSSNPIINEVKVTEKKVNEVIDEILKNEGGQA